MLHVNKLLIAFALTGLAACGHTSDPPVLATTPQIVIPRPAPVQLENIEVFVATQQNVNELNQRLNSGEVLVAMTREEFEQLLQNNQQVVVFIANSQSVMDQYEARITRAENNSN